MNPSRSPGAAGQKWAIRVTLQRPAFLGEHDASAFAVRGRGNDDGEVAIQLPRITAEEAGGVGESDLDELLGGRVVTESSEPGQGAGGAASAVDDEIGGKRFAGDADTGDAPVVGRQALDVGLLTHADVAHAAHFVTDCAFEEGAGEQNTLESTVRSCEATAALEPAGVARDVAGDGAGGDQPGGEAWKERLQDLPAAGEQSVCVAALGHAAAIFAGGRVSRSSTTT